MKSHKEKKVFIIMLSFIFIFTFLIVPVSAMDNENTVNENPSTEISTFWWPGNPNPIPGSEAWLQQHGGIKAKSSAKAKACGIKALKDAFIPGTAEAAIGTWLLKQVFSVTSFGLSFGVNAAYNYYQCVK